MRSLTLTVIAVALLGLVMSQSVLISDTTKTPEKCTDNPAPSKATCGSCSMVAGKMYADASASSAKMEFYCTACSNGKTPDSSPVTVTLTSAQLSASYPTFDVNMGSKCFAGLRAFSFLAVVLALFFQTF